MREGPGQVCRIRSYYQEGNSQEVCHFPSVMHGRCNGLWQLHSTHVLISLAVRSYVYYLETRVSYLESVLQSNSITFAAPERLDLSSRPGPDPNALHTPTDEHQVAFNNGRNVTDASNGYSSGSRGMDKKQNEAEKLSNLVSNIGM